jgi:ribonuclease Z
LILTVLGAGSASPQLHRHPSAFLLSVDNEYILIDCGEGTQYRLMEQKIKHTRLRTICISHLHGDHYFGLVGLLSSLSLNGRTEPMLLIGPPELKEILDLQFRYSETELNYNLRFLPTTQEGISSIYENSVFKIETFPLVHRVKTTGFKIIKKRGLRHLKPDLLPENFPLSFIRLLKEGRDVTDPLTKKIYTSQDYTTAGEREIVFAYCSDTAYSEALIHVLKGADLLYHEATFTEELAARALKTNHSTAKDAALIASKAEVKKLLIGHFSSRYKDYAGHLAESCAVFAATELAEEGQRYRI